MAMNSHADLLGKENEHRHGPLAVKKRALIYISIFFLYFASVNRSHFAIKPYHRVRVLATTFLLLYNEYSIFQTYNGRKRKLGGLSHG